jgi:hypothetical protein
VPSTVNPITLQNLVKEVADFRDRISSRAVTIDNQIFRSLSRTVDWVTRHLLSDPDQVLACLDAPTLLRINGRDFFTNQDTRKALYQNKKAGISNFSLTLHSSFGIVLPDIMGNSSTVGAEGNGMVLPWDKSYNDWFCNDDGVMTGMKPRILERIANQRDVHETILENFSVTHPVVAAMARKLLC